MNLLLLPDDDNVYTFSCNRCGLPVDASGPAEPCSCGETRVRMRAARPRNDPDRRREILLTARRMETRKEAERLIAAFSCWARAIELVPWLFGIGLVLIMAGLMAWHC